MKVGAVELPEEALREFCRKWRIKEFALFGSVLRDDFGPESDVDVLVTFEDEARPTLFDLTRMEQELERVLGRDVDVVSRRGIERSRNVERRTAILSSARVLFGAA